MRVSLPILQSPMPEAILSLAPHRLLPLQNDKLAVMAERNTGWFLTTPHGYQAIRDFFDDPHRLSDLAETSVQSLVRQLWQAGLILADGKSHPDTFSKPNPYPSSLLLKLTGTCNLSCTYCYDYEETRFHANLSFERIEETLRFLLANRDSLSIVFHGGEPLLRFSLLQDVVKLAKRIAGDTKSLKFAIQTNALLFKDEIIAFLEENNFSVGISLDGIDDETNGLRVFRNGKGSAEKIRNLLNRYRDFVRNSCGVLAVVSRTSVSRVPDFALWLQDEGIQSLTISFLDVAGRGQNLIEEKLKPDEAVNLYARLLEMIRSREIVSLALLSLLSRIDNLFTFQPRDFCHKGPCAAASDFLVLDSEGEFRSCDCVYDPYFVLAHKNDGVAGILNSPKREAVNERHEWLRHSGRECHSCSLFGVCGGTCVAKAIASRGDALNVDPVDCAISKFIYPTILEELAKDNKSEVLKYYEHHRFQSRISLS